MVYPITIRYGDGKCTQFSVKNIERGKAHGFLYLIGHFYRTINRFDRANTHHATVRLRILTIDRVTIVYEEEEQEKSVRGSVINSSATSSRKSHSVNRPPVECIFRITETSVKSFCGRLWSWSDKRTRK